MTYTPKLGQGSANKNTRKTKDTQPDWRGDFVGLDGIRYNLSIWEKTGSRGTFLSVAVSPYTPPPAKTPLQVALDAVDDDIPF